MAKKKRLKAWIIDRTFLIVTGIGVFIVLTTISLFLLLGNIISENGFSFLSCTILYFFVIYLAAIKMRMLKVYRPRWIPLIILLLLILLPVIIFFLFFDLLLGSLPNRLGYYWLGMIVLGTSSLIIFKECLKWLHKKGYIERNTIKPDTLLKHQGNV
jgi:hypothetical protein